MAERSILITGCSSGIGLAAARILKSRGWRVLATARQPDDLKRLSSEIEVEAIYLDLTIPETIKACAEDTLARTEGRLFALFNNGAYGQPGAVEDLTAETLRTQLEVNVVGGHDLTRRLLPGMLAQGKGRIVQNSSVLGLVSGPFRGAYSASKFAMEGLTDAMRIELSGTGVQVSLIEPGPISTRFIDNAIAAARANIDLENSRHRVHYATMISTLENGGKQTFKLEPEAVVAKLIHALESPRAKQRYYVTTPTYAAAIAKRLLPTSMLDWLAAKN